MLTVTSHGMYALSALRNMCRQECVYVGLCVRVRNWLREGLTITIINLCDGNGVKL